MLSWFVLSWLLGCLLLACGCLRLVGPAVRGSGGVLLFLLSVLLPPGVLLSVGGLVGVLRFRCGLGWLLVLGLASVLLWVLLLLGWLLSWLAGFLLLRAPGRPFGLLCGPVLLCRSWCFPLAARFPAFLGRSLGWVLVRGCRLLLRGCGLPVSAGCLLGEPLLVSSAGAGPSGLVPVFFLAPVEDPSRDSVCFKNKSKKFSHAIRVARFLDHSA